MSAIRFALLMLIAPSLLSAQKSFTMSDAILKGNTALAPTNLKGIQWVPGTAQFTHVSGNKLLRVNTSSQTVDTLDVLSKINQSLKENGAAELENLPAIKWSSASSAWFNAGDKLYLWSEDRGVTLKNSVPAGAENTDIQDKTFAMAFTKGSSLYISINGKETTVANSDEDGIVYGKSVHRDEFGISKGTFWSNAGRALAFYRMDERMVTAYPIYLLDSMPAQARMIRYPYAGAKSHHVTIGVYDVEKSKTIYLKTGEPAEQYLTNLAWTPDDKHILVAIVNREQNHFWLRQYDAQTGELVNTLFEETHDKWVEPEKPAHFVPGSNNQFLWHSERDGFNHLYLCDLSGKVLRQLSKGASPVTNFYGFSADGSRCFYQQADESGMNRNLFSADVKTGQIIRLTDEEGTHNGIFSPDGQWFLDVFNNIATPRFVYLAPTAKPSDRRIVFGAPNPLDGYALGLLRLLNLQTAEGTLLNARMILPPNFDSKKQYPAIVYVYNGPHVQLVTNTWLGASELWMHRMAQLGYVIFTLDGRGSANRGLVFENAIHRQVGTLEVSDQLTGVNYLKAQTYIDPSRIGVYGWSYGGFMATSLMTRPESKGVFKCGIAGGPVIDWRMYEIMYTERYMDTPQENPDGFAQNSLFKYIDNLEGRLLLIHGSSDDVVLWQHSLKYIRECVRKGKAVDYFVYPEHLHNVRGKDRVHLFEKIERFFVENL